MGISCGTFIFVGPILPSKTIGAVVIVVFSVAVGSFLSRLNSESHFILGGAVGIIYSDRYHPASVFLAVLHNGISIRQRHPILIYRDIRNLIVGNV